MTVSKRKDEWVARWFLPKTEEEQEQEREQISKSYASDSDMEIPAPEGLSYLPYQRAGIEYGMNRDAVLIGDQPGLGKTIQSIGIVNCMKKPRNVLVIVPATLRLNWQRELKKWLVHDLSIGIVSSGSKDAWVTDNVVIINFENVVRHKSRIDRRKWDVVIVDEAHRLKNPKAKRTRAILGGERGDNPITATKRILLTGTPICNRPIELYPLVSYLSPKHFGNFWGFARAYCDARQTSIPVAALPPFKLHNNAELLTQPAFSHRCINKWGHSNVKRERWETLFDWIAFSWHCFTFPSDAHSGLETNSACGRGEGARSVLSCDFETTCS